MSKLDNLIAIGFDKNGEADFAITATIMDLSYEDMKEIRAMVCVAIGTAEDMWRRNRQANGAAASENQSRTLQAPKGHPDWFKG